jgi:hypothetical protein
LGRIKLYVFVIRKCVEQALLFLPAQRRAEEGASLEQIEDEDRAELLAKAREKQQKKREKKEEEEKTKKQEQEAAEAEEKKKNGKQHHF